LSEVQTCLVSILKIGGDYMTFEWDLLANQITVFDNPPPFHLDSVGGGQLNYSCGSFRLLCSFGMVWLPNCSTYLLSAYHSTLGGSCSLIFSWLHS
jgi:hypothetical protein